MRKMILGFAVAIMLMAASAQAQGAVWSATFTPGDINGYAFGCRNGDDDAECSNKDVLSDDTFTVGEIVYTVTEFYQTSGTNRLYFAGIRTPEDGTSWVDIADELKIGSTSLDIGYAFLSQGQNSTSAWRLRWSGDPGLDDVLGGDSLTDGTSISVTLISGDLPPPPLTCEEGEEVADGVCVPIPPPPPPTCEEGEEVVNGVCVTPPPPPPPTCEAGEELVNGVCVTPPPPPPPPPPASNFPTADAGPDQLGVWEGALVMLDGSGSSDPDDDPLRYRWNQISGEPVVLSSQNIVNPTFTAPQGLTAEAVLQFRLLVTDPSTRFDSDTVTVTVDPEAEPPPPEDRIYYFPHLAVGASWQTTITYINYSREEVTCQTDFISDHGSPLMVSFAELGTVDSRTDVLPPGGSVHQETDVELSGPLVPGWARATCTGPVQASLLFRWYNSEGMPVAEAGVNAATVPATRFVTFAEQGEGKNGTGVAYANPSDTAALVTFTVRDADGEVLAIEDLMLPPNWHGAQNMPPLFDLSSFTGSLEITSTEPIVSLSLNFEADPVFSSLPPGELDASAQGSTTYYFPHLAVGASWQTTITYINYSPQQVSCQTDFLSDFGSPLMVSFAGRGTVISRNDVLPPGGSVHQETNVELSGPLVPGWARVTCSGPVQASLLYRRRNSEGIPTGEAGVNATAVPATRFVTFAEQGEGRFGTGVAYANPSPNISVPVTFTARDTAGELLASVVRTLLPGGHDAHGISELFDLSSFTGSIEVTSTEPIFSLSVNFEADPVFSSLPPGELDAAAQ